MSLTPTPTNSMLRYTPPTPPSDENYSLSTYIHHTFTLSDANWRQLALALERACSHWSPHTALSPDGDALTFYPRFSDTEPASDRAATYFTLTPCFG